MHSEISRSRAVCHQRGARAGEAVMAVLAINIRARSQGLLRPFGHGLSEGGNAAATHLCGEIVSVSDPQRASVEHNGTLEPAGRSPKQECPRSFPLCLMMCSKIQRRFAAFVTLYLPRSYVPYTCDVSRWYCTYAEHHINNFHPSGHPGAMTHGSLSRTEKRISTQHKAIIQCLVRGFFSVSKS